jgi:anti-anti-sigma factor
LSNLVVERSATSVRAASPEFVCSWRAVGLSAGWVHVAGELDLATSPQLRRTLRKALQSVRLLMLDLRELSFIDCSGAHVILDVAEEAERDGDQLLIVRGPAQVDRLLALTAVGARVPIIDLAPAEPVSSLLHVAPPGSCGGMITDGTGGAGTALSQSRV